MKTLLLSVLLLFSLYTQAQRALPISQRNLEPLDYRMQREGNRFSKELTEYNSWAPANATSIMNTSVNFPAGFMYYVSTVSITASQACRLEIQYPKDPTSAGNNGQFPLTQENVILEPGVEKTIEARLLWPQGARFEVRYMANLQVPPSGYMLLTSTATADLAISKFYRVSNGSTAATVTLSTTNAKIGDRVVVTRATGATGTVTVATSSGQIQAPTAATFAATQTLRSDNYGEYEWDGTNWNTPTLRIWGRYSGYELTAARTLYSEYVILGCGDSIMKASSGVATGSPWYFPYFGRVVQGFQKRGYDVRGINKAIPGLKATGASDLLQRSDYYATQPPSVILYGLAMNDAGGGVDASKLSTFQSNLTEFLDWARGRYPLAYVLILGGTPAQEATQEGGLVTLRSAASALVAARTDRVSAGKTRIHYIEMGDLFDRTVFANYATTDTNGSAVHPNQVGQDAMAARILDYCDANNIKPGQ